MPKTIMINGEEIEILGEGSFSVILPDPSRSSVVIKHSKSDRDLQKKETIFRLFRNELTILNRLKAEGQHPYIVNMIEGGEATDGSFFRIYFEQLGQDLEQYMGELENLNQSCSFYQIYHIMFCISSALAYLHERKIIHRDVKIENIMLMPGQNHQVKLIDFGLAYQLSDTEFQDEKTPGSVFTLAPESYENKIYSDRSDMYALASVLFTLVFSYSPFARYLLNNQAEIRRLLVQGYRDQIHSTGQPILEWLIHCLWAPDPHNRLSAQTVLKWVKFKIDSDELSQEQRPLRELDMTEKKWRPRELTFFDSNASMPAEIPSPECRIM